MDKYLVKDSNTTIIITGCKSDLNWAIDNSLIKLMHQWAEEEVTICSKTQDKVEEALSLMISSILNRTGKEKKISETTRNVGSSPHSFKLVFFKCKILIFFYFYFSRSHLV